MTEEVTGEGEEKEGEGGKVKKRQEVVSGVALPPASSLSPVVG